MKARPEDLADLAAVNARFAEEVARLAFEYRCDACAHVAGRPGNLMCSLGYPNKWLRGEHRLVQPDGMLTFCKYFELGENVERGPGTG